MSSTNSPDKYSPPENELMPKLLASASTFTSSDIITSEVLASSIDSVVITRVVVPISTLADSSTDSVVVALDTLSVNDSAGDDSVDTRSLFIVGSSLEASIRIESSA